MLNKRKIYIAIIITLLLAALIECVSVRVGSPSEIKPGINLIETDSI